jgi:hypothetical protein
MGRNLQPPNLNHVGTPRVTTQQKTKGNKMTQCKVPNCTNTDLVFSGVDAFMLGGIPTESYCYSCANAYAVIKNSVDALNTLSA